MKFFVSAKWEERDMAKRLMDELEFRGHTITYDWTKEVEPSSEIAVKDIQGVLDADVYVGLFENDNLYQGALIEMGAALAHGKLVEIIGHALDDCIFMWHPLLYRRETVRSFLEVYEET